MGTPRADPGHPAGRPRRRQRSAFKARVARVALEALTGQKTLNELASAFGVHPVQIAQWKRPLLDARAGVFASGAPGRREREHEPLGEHRYQEIGPVLASGWWRWTGCEKRASPACQTGPTTGVDRADASAVAQRAAGRPAGQRARGDLLGSARAGRPAGQRARGDDEPIGETEGRQRGDRGEHLILMRLVDEPYPQTPFSGVERMTGWRRRQGDVVTPKRGRRRLRRLGWEALDPKPRVRRPEVTEQRSPSLLRGRAITAGNAVWSRVEHR